MTDPTTELANLCDALDAKDRLNQLAHLLDLFVTEAEPEQTERYACDYVAMDQETTRLVAAGDLAGLAGLILDRLIEWLDLPALPDRDADNDAARTYYTTRARHLLDTYPPPPVTAPAPAPAYQPTPVELLAAAHAAIARSTDPTQLIAWLAVAEAVGDRLTELGGTDPYPPATRLKPPLVPPRSPWGRH